MSDNKKVRKEVRGRNRGEFEVTPFGRKLRRSRGSLLMSGIAMLVYPIGVLARWFRFNRAPKPVPVPVHSGPAT